MEPGKDRTGRLPKKGRKRRQAPNKVLENARVEIPLFPLSIVQFSFEPFSPIFTEEMNKRMRMKWTEMSTVYAGPFSKNCNLRALKRLFKSFGPIRSMTLVLETHQPHLCIQYEVLEAAQLAIESLDGILVESTSIKHSWFTLWPRTDGNKR